MTGLQAIGAVAGICGTGIVAIIAIMWVWRQK